jgi:hypothetical protein
MKPGMVVYAFNPSTWEGGRGRQISEFEAILVYKVSSRTARAICLYGEAETPSQKKKKKKKEWMGHLFCFCSFLWDGNSYFSETSE